MTAIFALAVSGCTSDDQSDVPPDGSPTHNVQTTPGAEPPPVSAVSGVLDALRHHDVVAIGESHNLAEAGQFYVQLLTDKHLAELHPVVVVEFGNHLYQSIINRYLRGGRVEREPLRAVWQNTTQVGAWDAPMYQRFFAAARHANAGSNGGQGIQVVLGDPPINWDHRITTKDWRRITLRRETFMADQIRHQVARGRPVLVVAGLAHVPHGQGGITQLLDRQGIDTYVLATHLGFLEEDWERALASWPKPSVAPLKGTWIGNLPKGEGVAEDAFDALLYLRPPGQLHLSAPLPSTYRDAAYWRELKERWSIAYQQPFSARAILALYGEPVYPDATVDTSGVATLLALTACMKQHGIQDFPAPEMGFDSFNIGPPNVSEPGFTHAREICGNELGLPPPPMAKPTQTPDSAPTSPTNS